MFHFFFDKNVTHRLSHFVYVSGLWATVALCSLLLFFINFIISIIDMPIYVVIIINIQSSVCSNPRCVKQTGSLQFEE